MSDQDTLGFTELNEKDSTQFKDLLDQKLRGVVGIDDTAFIRE